MYRVKLLIICQTSVWEWVSNFIAHRFNGCNQLFMPGFKLIMFIKMGLGDSSDQNGQHLADDILKCIFFRQKSYTFIPISLQFVPERRIDDTSALINALAWCRRGNKPLPETIDPVYWRIYAVIPGDQLIMSESMDNGLVSFEVCRCNYLNPYSLVSKKFSTILRQGNSCHRPQMALNLCLKWKSNDCVN